ncbi:LacI family DNA-binding transcriptional regulator [Crassaminicella profunda]|uniref:LacI family DNA-binding transcriptional regulator n=1 Tax=Crassaminicella profunda TaxID=1286698 RepID=UPI001CA69D13|nr:LacI family DNA-binding transcriptional regulator [Crassaminicella profunda]QZY53808.1 LacI family transcriptional regulator [Crassaminicella profunda]
MATVEDIVKKSGVSRSTVFRFLNGSNVRENSKKKIIQAMKELNFKVDAINKHKNFVIEISVSHDYDEFQGFSQVVQGVIERAEKSDVLVQLARRVGKQIDEDYAKWDHKNKTKGVIIVGKNKEDEEKEANILAEKGIPHVFVNRVLSGNDINFVGVDLEQGAYDIVSYLIEKGHKKILAVGNPEELYVDEKKLKGYKRALMDHGIELDDRLSHTISNKSEWEDVIRKVLTSEDVPDAYFGLCDSYSVKFISIARSLGYEVPQDISVVGMDDIDLAKYSFPTLTTVKVPFKKMGTIAVEQMIQLFNQVYSNVKIMIKHELIERDSVENRS